MATDIGRLAITLSANASQYNAEMTKAAQRAQSFSAGLKQASGAAQTAMGGLQSGLLAMNLGGAVAPLVTALTQVVVLAASIASGNWLVALLVAVGLAVQLTQSLFNYGSSLMESVTSQRRLAAELGVTVAEIQRFTFAAQMAGVAIEEATALARKLRETAGKLREELVTGGGALTDAFARRLQIDPRAFAQARTLREQVDLLSDAYRRIPNEADRLAVFNQLFKNQSQDLLRLVSRTAEWRDQMERVGRLAGTFMPAEEMERAAAVWDGFKQSMTIVWEVLKGIGGSAVAIFGPALESVTRTVNSLVNDFGGLVVAVRQLAPVILAVLGYSFVGAIYLVVYAVEGVMWVARAVQPILVELWNVLAAGWDAVRPLIQAAWELGVALWPLVEAMIQWSAAGIVVQAAVALVVAWFRTLVGVLQWVAAQLNRLSEFIRRDVLPVIANMANRLQDFFGMLAEVPSLSRWQGFFYGLAQGAGEAANRIREIASAVGSAAGAAAAATNAANAALPMGRVEVPKAIEFGSREAVSTINANVMAASQNPLIGATNRLTAAMDRSTAAAEALNANLVRANGGGLAASRPAAIGEGDVA